MPWISRISRIAGIFTASTACGERRAADKLVDERPTCPECSAIAADPELGEDF